MSQSHKTSTQLKRGTDVANRAGTRSINVDHLLFLIRCDKPKVARVRNFLSWKDVRKNVRDNDDKAGGGGGGDDFGGAGPDELGGAGAVAPNTTADAAAKGMNKHKKAKVKLPWDVHSYYAYQPPEREDEEGDEEDEEMNSATLARLRNADERTRDMTREEYVHFSDCRQASFTFRKGKRFREWAGFGVVTDSKPSDDVIDILGFLTFEIVQWLTEEALRVKASEDASAKVNRRAAGGGRGGDSRSESGGEDGSDGENGNGRKRKRDMRLFNPPEKERKPVQPKHVQEAYRRSQQSTLRENQFGFAKSPMHRHLKLVWSRFHTKFP